MSPVVTFQLRLNFLTSYALFPLTVGSCLSEAYRFAHFFKIVFT